MNLILLGISIGLLVAAIVMFLVLFIRTMLKVSFLMKGFEALSSRMDGQATWINKNEEQATRNLDKIKNELITYTDERVRDIK